jgi:hypothetical protein
VAETTPTASDQKHLKSIRKLFNTEDPGSLRQGYELLTALDSPAVVLTLAEGVSIDGDGHISLTRDAQRKGHLRRQSTRGYVALSVLRASGALDGIESLDLSVRSEGWLAAGVQWRAGMPNPMTPVPNRFDDLAPLHGLKKLRHLDLSHALGASGDAGVLAPLAGLRGLRSVNLSGARSLTDVSHLASCTALRTLRLGGCVGVTDLGSLSGLSKLTTVELMNCDGLTDLDALKAMIALKEVNISGCGVALDTSALSTCVALERVIAYGRETPFDVPEGVAVEGAVAVINVRTLGKLVKDDEGLWQIFRLSQRMGAEIWHNRQGVTIDEESMRAGSISKSYGGYGAAVEINAPTFGASWSLQPLQPSGRCPVFKGLTVVFAGTGWSRRVAEWEGLVAKDGGTVAARADAGAQLVVCGRKGRPKRTPPHALVVSEAALLEVVPIKAPRKKVSKENRNLVAKLRKLLKSSNAETVAQGCALLSAMVDVPEHRKILVDMAEGTELVDEQPDPIRSWMVPKKGTLTLGDPIKRVTRAADRVMVALSLLRCLGRLDAATCLTIDSNRSMERVGGLAGLTSLTTIRITNCGKLVDLSGLEDLPSLSTLEIRRCDSLTNVDGLAGLTGLQTLSLASNRELKSLDAIVRLSNLADVNLSGCYRLGALARGGSQALPSNRCGEYETKESCDELRKLVLRTMLDR